MLGLQSGADDYVTKPFGVLEAHRPDCGVDASSEPVARPRDHAGAPRCVPPTASKPIAEKHLARVRGRDIAVTPHEFELLYQLAMQPGVVLSRKALLAAVWRGQAFVTDRSIDTLVRHLRCKVEEDPGTPRLIVTVWGYGYKLRGCTTTDRWRTDVVSTGGLSSGSARASRASWRSRRRRCC